jgi:hypothetical protein
VKFIMHLAGPFSPAAGFAALNSPIRSGSHRVT